MTICFTSSKGVRGLGALLGILLSVTVLLNSTKVYGADGALVLAHDNVRDDYLTRGFLRSVFTLRVRSWPDGTPIQVFVMDDAHQLHKSFCRDVLGTYPYVLRRTWDRSTFAGTGLLPERVQSVEEMRLRVSSTPGAVGYAPDGGDGHSLLGTHMFQTVLQEAMP